MTFYAFVFLYSLRGVEGDGTGRRGKRDGGVVTCSGTNEYDR